ncbi:MAG: hypothetical protein ACYTAF_00155 [Planctomycetota bacterium]|jgi:hypothetical protein
MLPFLKMTKAIKVECMGDQERRLRFREETDVERLHGITAHDALSVDLVSGFAGDRPVTEIEKPFLSKFKDRRGEQFFPDLLYAITHQYFPPTKAEKLWKEILRHKHEMSKVLNRNVQIIVPTLDYLANYRSVVHLPTLVNEAHIASIANLSMRDGLTQLFNHTSCCEIIT